MIDSGFALRKEWMERVKRELLDALDGDERAAIEAATGEMGNKPEAVKLGWLKMRTKETWTKQRYTLTVGRALAKLKSRMEAEDAKTSS